MWAELFPGLVLGFREGLEAFLMIGIILDFLKKRGETELRRPVQWGLATGIAGSLLFGLALWGISRLLGTGEATEELWEALAALVGLVLLTTFVIWMMRHGKTVYQDVQAEVKNHFSAGGLFLISVIMVLREGAEIGLFAFSSVNQQTYTIGIGFGVVGAAVLAWLITRALVRLNLKVLFSVTLGYVVLQCAYLLGYGVHELLHGLGSVGLIADGDPLFAKAWNLRGGIFDHKTGVVGLPLNILVGWSSAPEWLQLGSQLAYLAVLFPLWMRISRKVQKAS